MPPGLDSVDGLVELTAGFNTLRALHLLPIYLSLFCTVAMMNLLVHSDVWFCDGTFFESSSFQLFGVFAPACTSAYANQGSSAMVAFGFLSGKTHAAHVLFFTSLVVASEMAASPKL